MQPPREGYKNFGSFHTDNVEELILRDLSQLPANPFARDVVVPPFGRPCRDAYRIDFDSWTFINHGAFGATLRVALQESTEWREHCERQPLRFLDRELFPHVIRVMKELAPLLGCQAQDTALVPNATTALNVVAQSVDLTEGDTVFMLDIGYGSVKKIFQGVQASTGAKLVLGTVPLPLRSAEEVLEVVQSQMPASTKLAVFDAVTSNTALVLPLPQLLQLCHDRGVQVLVDGAHALGMLPLALDELRPDYFVTNCHKWFCGPRGTAVLWVRRDHQAGVRPLVVSHGSGCGFTSDFIWDGCRDYAPALGLSAAVQFWQAAGLDNVQRYMRILLRDAVQLLTSSWGTDTLAPLELCGAMALVRLPGAVLGSGMQEQQQQQQQQHTSDDGAVLGGGVQEQQQQHTSDDAKYIQDLLHFQHKVECPVKCIKGVLYVRISAHIYNELADYQALATAVHAICKSAAADRDAKTRPVATA